MMMTKHEHETNTHEPNDERERTPPQEKEEDDLNSTRRFSLSK